MYYLVYSWRILIDMMKINVVCGGTSDERDVSLRSGNAVAEALRQKGHAVEILDTSDSDARIVRCDVVFPVLHGVGGEDGQFQARLEKTGVPFVGSGSEASRLCMDKSLYRQAAQAAGFLMAEGRVVNEEGYTNDPLAKQPHVLKPIDGGSSIDTLIVRDPRSIDRQLVRDMYSRHRTMLLEQLITGTEVTVGVLADNALPVIEIIPPSDEEFDYKNKYNGKTQELCPPEHVTEALQEAAQALTLRVHTALGCRDLSRTDFIIEQDSNELYLLETNTIPGMTGQSLYPKMAAAAGMDFESLCDQLAEMALLR